MAPNRLSAMAAVPDQNVPDSEQAHAYGFGPFRLVPGERVLRRGEQLLPLPPKAFDTLLLLVRNAGHLMLKGELMKALWPDSFVEEVNLANNISLLRKTLGDKTTCWQLYPDGAETGYRFLSAVTNIWKYRGGNSDSRRGRSGGAEPASPVHLPSRFKWSMATRAIEFLGRSLPEAISASLAGLRSVTVRSSLLAARLAEGKARSPAHRSGSGGGSPACGHHPVRRRTNCESTRNWCRRPQPRCSRLIPARPGGTTFLRSRTILVHRIVEVLMLPLTEREKRALNHDVPASARAYEFYLRANHLQRERTVENLVLARDLYRECVEEDPNYAPAWARLGSCYRFLEKFGEEGPESLELAQWAFKRAFALNPDLSIAHNLYTQIEADLGNAQAAMVRLLAHAETHPNDPELFAGLVQSCRFCGLLDESVMAHQRARRLDSRAVTSVAHTFFLMGDYAHALESYDATAGYYLDAAILALTGREAEAVKLLSAAQLLRSSRRLDADPDRLACCFPERRPCGQRRSGPAGAGATGKRSGNQVLPGAASGAPRNTLGGVAGHTATHPGGFLLLHKFAARSLVAAAFTRAGVPGCDGCNPEREARARAAFVGANGERILSLEPIKWPESEP